jgi:hypothetical protein
MTGLREIKLPPTRTLRLGEEEGKSAYIKITASARGFGGSGFESTAWQGRLRESTAWQARRLPWER